MCRCAIGEYFNPGQSGHIQIHKEIEPGRPSPSTRKRKYIVTGVGTDVRDFNEGVEPVVLCIVSSLIFLTDRCDGTRLNRTLAHKIDAL